MSKKAQTATTRALSSEEMEAERIYERIGHSAQAWLAQAKYLKMSAALILTQMKAVLPIPPALPGISDQKVAYIQSFMLLTGFAFENLIKGILVGRDPSVIERDPNGKDRLILSHKRWRQRGGHGLSHFAQCICSLLPLELDLFKRLEEYLFWAGRYPIPNNSEDFLESQANSLLTYRSNDPELIDALFERYTEILNSDWRARGNE